MKIGPLILLKEEEQDRKDLLHWQEKLMDVFPESYDVGLATRAPYTKGEAINVVTVARGGKELFYFDTRRSSGSFHQSMGVCGEMIRPFTIDVRDLQKSVNWLMLMYELQRKISNLLSDAKCIIEKDRRKINALVVEVQSKTHGFDNGHVKVEYKPNVGTYYVKVKNTLGLHASDVGSTRDMAKAIDLVEKAFKSLSE